MTLMSHYLREQNSSSTRLTPSFCSHDLQHWIHHSNAIHCHRSLDTCVFPKLTSKAASTGVSKTMSYEAMTAPVLLISAQYAMTLVVTARTQHKTAPLTVPHWLLHWHIFHYFAGDIYSVSWWLGRASMSSALMGLPKGCKASEWTGKKRLVFPIEGSQ